MSPLFLSRAATDPLASCPTRCDRYDAAFCRKARYMGGSCHEMVTRRWSVIGTSLIMRAPLALSGRTGASHCSGSFRPPSAGTEEKLSRTMSSISPMGSLAMTARRMRGAT